MNYASTDVPRSYECYDCKARGVKLWRQYQTCADKIQLLCLDCACKNQHEHREPTEDGKSLYTGKVRHLYRTSDMKAGWWCGYDPAEGLPAVHGVPELKVDRERTDSIGWLVPAVPTEDEETFWGYTSVPQAGCEWWYRLPYRREDKP